MSNSLTLRMHANEHPQGPPASVGDAMRVLSSVLHRYPDPPSELQTAIAKLHGVPPNRVLLGAGSAEIIGLAWRAFTNPARAVFFRVPEFELYSMLSAQCGTPAITHPWQPHEDLGPQFAGAEVGLVALSNPHNPTGTLLPRQVIADLADSLADTTVVLNDEAYYEYADSGVDGTSLEAMSEHSNILTTRTFSKIYGLAGLRIGYGIGNARMITRLRDLQMPFTVSVAACAAALAVLADPAFVAERCACNKERREILESALTRRGFEVRPSQANFLLARTPPGQSAWAANLLDRGIRVNPVDTDLRITVGSDSEIAALLAAVDSILHDRQTAIQA
jgi:histidinol-phosphate aminotransferase